MANQDRPKGLEPYGQLIHAGKYVSGAAIYPGDAVYSSADGFIDPATSGDGVRLLGVALSYASAAGETVMVADSPDQEFVVQADGSDVDAATDIGQLCNLLTTAGNSAFKHSRMELDSSDIGTTVTAQMRILRIEPGVKNALGANVEVVCKINQHEHADGAAAV